MFYALTFGSVGSLTRHLQDFWGCLCVLELKSVICSPPWSYSPGLVCIWGLCSRSSPPLLLGFYGLCAAVQWPPSHPGATQPVQDSGTHGPCQNPIAPHLQSINASHSRSPTPSPTLPHTLTLLHFSLSLSHPLTFYFNFQIPRIPLFCIPSTPSSHHFWFYSRRTSTGSSLISPSLATPFLCLHFFIRVQRKNLSPIISSVGANQVWWQWTGNHKTFLIQRSTKSPVFMSSDSGLCQTLTYGLHLALPRCSWSPNSKMFICFKLMVSLTKMHVHLNSVPFLYTFCIVGVLNPPPPPSPQRELYNTPPLGFYKMCSAHHC